MMRARTTTGAVLALVVALLLSGCGLTMRDLPIPGTGVSGDTMEITADFSEALNLAKGAPVKVNGVDSGKVKEIGEHDFTAEVTLTVRKDAELRKGATARLRYTTPLGELFIDVSNPDHGPLLSDGDKLTLSDTATAPTVEDALSEASLLINGGGLDQLQTVTEQLDTALNGHEGEYRMLINRASTFLTEANSTTGSIDRVLTSLNSLSKTLDGRKETINKALRDIRPAAKVLREHTPQFTELLAELQKFSTSANSTVDATRSQLLRMLRQVEPVLAEFDKNKNRWGASLNAIIRAAGVADEVVDNNYLNIGINLHTESLLKLSTLTDVLGNLLNVIGLGGLLGGPGGGGLLGGSGGGLLGGSGGGLLGGLTGALGGNRTAAPRSTGGGNEAGPTSTSLTPLLNGLLGGGN